MRAAISIPDLSLFVLKRNIEMEKSGNSTEYNPVKRRRHSYVTERAQPTDYLTKLLKEKSGRYSIAIGHQ